MMLAPGANLMSTLVANQSPALGPGSETGFSAFLLHGYSISLHRCRFALVQLAAFFPGQQSGLHLAQLFFR